MSPFARPLLLLLSIGCFFASLPFDAAVYERAAHGGFFMLTMGWMGLMMLHFGWCANPMLFLGWAFLGLAKRQSARLITLVLFSLAMVFALSSYVTLDVLDMIGRNEAEMAGELEHYGPSIYLWTLSIGIGLTGAILRWIEGKRELAAAQSTGR